MQLWKLLFVGSINLNTLRTGVVFLIIYNILEFKVIEIILIDTHSIFKTVK